VNTNRCCRSSSKAGRTPVMGVEEEEELSSQLVAYSFLFLRPTGRGKPFVVEEQDDGSYHLCPHPLPVLLNVLVAKDW
jgi:hypothetical protein